MVDTVTVVLADLLCSELCAFILFIYLFKEHPRRFKSHLPKIFRRKHLAVTFLRELDCCVFICKIFIPHYFLPAFLLYHSFSSVIQRNPVWSHWDNTPIPCQLCTRTSSVGLLGLLMCICAQPCNSDTSCTPVLPSFPGAMATKAA